MEAFPLSESDSAGRRTTDFDLSSREFRDRYAPRNYWPTWVFNQRIGGFLAPRFLRAGLSPNAVSALSAGFGVATSAATVILFHYSSVLAGLVALVGWQIAYTLDYTDGQMARASGLASPRGAVFDLMCDHLFQASTAVAVVTIALLPFSGPFANMLAVVFGLSWLVPFVHGISMANKLESPISETVSKFGVGRIVRHGRDYMVQISVISVAIMLGNLAVLVVLAGLTAVNLAFMCFSMYRVGFGGNSE